VIHEGMVCTVQNPELSMLPFNWKEQVLVVEPIVAGNYGKRWRCKYADRTIQDRYPSSSFWLYEQCLVPLGGPW
jgi:hypothetical protein